MAKTKSILKKNKTNIVDSNNNLKKQFFEVNEEEAPLNPRKGKNNTKKVSFTGYEKVEVKVQKKEKRGRKKVNPTIKHKIKVVTESPNTKKLGVKNVFYFGKNKALLTYDEALKLRTEEVLKSKYYTCLYYRI